MKSYVMCSVRVSGDYGSWQTCHEQVNGYKNDYYRGFTDREEVEDDYSVFVLKHKRKHEVANGAG